MLRDYPERLFLWLDLSTLGGIGGRRVGFIARRALVKDLTQMAADARYARGAD